MEKYSEEMRAGFIQEWKASGKVVSVFCGERGINKNTFRYWLKRERRKPATGFVELRGAVTPSLSMNELRIELGKLKMTLSGEKSSGDVEAIIKILRALAC